MPHPDSPELAALGALDGEERAAFETHLREGCPECETSVREWEREISLFALSVPAADPPATLRARMLQAAGSPTPVRKTARSAGPSRWLALAACLLLALAIADDLAQRRSVRESQRRAATLSSALERSRENVARTDLRFRFLEDPDVVTVLLSPLPASPGCRGKILFSAKARRAILLAVDLPRLPAGRQYELWFIAAGKPIAAGVFDTRSARPTVFESTLLPEGVPGVEKFAVTIEPRGGTLQPSGPMVLLGSA